MILFKQCSCRYKYLLKCKTIVFLQKFCLMNNFSYLLLFICQIQILYSQDYEPMAVETATWIMTYSDPLGEDHDWIALKIEGDTILNNKTYSKIYHYDMYGNGVHVESRKLLGLIRDDLNSKKVYGGLLNGIQYGFGVYLNTESECGWEDTSIFEEKLLYDFSLKEGDLVSNCMLPNSSTIIKDEMIMRYGLQRRSLTLGDNDNTIMTEGIGGCLGIFKGRECIETGVGSVGSLYLFKYCQGSFSNCNILTSTNEEIISNTINIYPNPVFNELVISNSQGIKRITLFNLFGGKIESYVGANYIEMTNYPSGVYFLKIEDLVGGSYVRKVIKE